MSHIGSSGEAAAYRQAIVNQYQFADAEEIEEDGDFEDGEFIAIEAEEVEPSEENESHELDPEFGSESFGGELDLSA